MTSSVIWAELDHGDWHCRNAVVQKTARGWVGMVFYRRQCTAYTLRLPCFPNEDVAMTKAHQAMNRLYKMQGVELRENEEYAIFGMFQL